MARFLSMSDAEAASTFGIIPFIHPFGMLLPVRQKSNVQQKPPSGGF